MRRSFAVIPYTVTSRATTITDAFSTSSAGGGGIGRGGSTPFQFTAYQSDKDDDSPPMNRTRVKPIPSFSSLANPPTMGIGRGSIPNANTFPKPNMRMPFRSAKIGAEDKVFGESETQLILPGEIINVLSGVGRGKPGKPAGDQPEKPKLQNRHILLRQQSLTSSGANVSGDRVKSAFMSGRGNERGGRGRVDRDHDLDDDSADGEKLAHKLGPKFMDQFTEVFDEMSHRVLPSPLDNSILDAFHTNMMIECEPEYMMEEFGTNPDIEEKPNIPLRSALEKMKPFLMAYEGIQNEEEWQQVMEETMSNVPLIKEIVEYYCGADRVTAKQQIQELENVAKTITETAPDSVKRFTDRVVISLHSNPGWGFDKKCQFMDKLVMEVCQQYKKAYAGSRLAE